MVAEAWRRVTTKTIVNCFHHAGFCAKFGEDGDDEDDDDEDNIPLAQLAKHIPGKNAYEESEFVSIDDHVYTCAAMNDEDIVAEITDNGDSSEDESDDSVEKNFEPETSLNEALDFTSKLQKFLCVHDCNVTEEEAGVLSSIKHKLEAAFCEKFSCQSKITDFFKHT